MCHLQYSRENHMEEMTDYLRQHGFEPSETVGMMTAVYLEAVSYRFLQTDDFSLFVVVTAGVGNAVDASLADQHSSEPRPGTINTWVFVNGHMAEEAFIHAIVTATEAKVKALHELDVKDPVTNTLATGTSTDSMLIAATQRGAKLQYAGTITPLGKLISRGVYDCTVEAIEKNRQRVKYDDDYTHVYAITLAFFLDLLIGDPPKWPHPVKWMGMLIGRLDKKLNTGPHKKRNGIIMLLTVLLLVLVITTGITYLAYQLHVIAGILVEAILISTTIAQKSLRGAGMEVYRPLVEGNMAEARLKLSYIVGRDTEKLDESEIVRGTVETVAENTSDGITAPLFWAFIGGAPLAMVYRAINTCDSMVGYKNEKYSEFGWASAKLDDVVNWIPSRITGFLMLLGLSF